MEWRSFEAGMLCQDTAITATWHVQVFAARMATAIFVRASTTDAVSKSYGEQMQILLERIKRMSRMDQVS